MVKRGSMQASALNCCDAGELGSRPRHVRDRSRNNTRASCRSLLHGNLDVDDSVKLPLKRIASDAKGQYETGGNAEDGTTVLQRVRLGL